MIPNLLATVPAQPLPLHFHSPGFNLKPAGTGIFISPGTFTSTSSTVRLELAFIAYRKAADQGDAAAQNHLGNMYVLAQALTQDYIEAHKWFNIAAAYSTVKEIRDTAIRTTQTISQRR